MLVDRIADADGGDPTYWYCGYCHEPVKSVDRDFGERVYHCAQCKAEGKGFNPEVVTTLYPCGHVFQNSEGSRATLVLNP